jgi:hypothetical protein
MSEPNTSDKELAKLEETVHEKTRELAARGDDRIRLDTLPKLKEFCLEVARAPQFKRWQHPADVFVAIVTGEDAGLSRSAALNNLYVVNGKVQWEGTALLAKIRTHPDRLPLPKGLRLVDWGGEGDDYGATVTTWRKGDPQPESTRYCIKDARRAKLWGKAGPWTSDPKMMMAWRAIGQHGKLYWSDVTLGLDTVQDFPLSPGKVEVIEENREPPKSDPLLDRIIDADVVQPTGEPQPDPAPEPEPEPPGEEPQSQPDPHPGLQPGPQEPEERAGFDKCPNCERVEMLLKSHGHRADCVYVEIGKRLPTQDEVENM